MSVECSAAVWKRNFGNSTRKLIAVRLADHADDHGRGIWPAVGSIAAQCNLHARTVQRTLREFVREGLLIVTRDGGLTGPGSPTRYDFDMDAIGQLPFVENYSNGCDPDRSESVKRGGAVPPLRNKRGGRAPPLEDARGGAEYARGGAEYQKGRHSATQTVIEPSENRQLGFSDENPLLDFCQPSSGGERKFYPLDFEEAWMAYPRTAAMSKREAHAAWRRLSRNKRERVRRAIPHFAAYCRDNDWYHPIHMCRFISKGRYEVFEHGYTETRPAGGRGRRKQSLSEAAAGFLEPEEPSDQSGDQADQQLPYRGE